MIVSSLHLENFRNYKELDLNFSPGVNVLFGNNGQGKTNVIESIYMCACARSHRTGKDQELIYHNEDQYKIDLKYFSSFKDSENSDFEEHIGIHYKQLNTVANDHIRFKRDFFKDNIQITKVSEFVGQFHAVMFAPEDLQIIKSGPSERRRFLDLLISQVKPSYFKNLQDYGHILKQRNALLKKYREQDTKLDVLQEAEIEIWDEAFANKAAKIIQDRFITLDKLNYFAGNFHKDISGGLEEIKLKYDTISSLYYEMDIEEMVANIYKRLQQNRDFDVIRGYTSLGPHRDDFDILFNSISLKTFGSQGQQRTAVLAMKMAELEIIRHDSKEAPILLLDDVMSELDANRRKQLVNSLQHIQIFVTCTDPEQLDQDWLENLNSNEISYYKVDQGKVERMENTGRNMV